MDKITIAQANTFKAIRNLPVDVAKEVRSALWATIKNTNGIAHSDKLKVEVDDTSSPLYCVIIRKKTGNAYNNGVEVQAPTPAQEAWFKVNMEAAVDDIRSYQDFENDGVSEPEGDVLAQSVDGYTIKVVDGDIYVLLNESEFN